MTQIAYLLVSGGATNVVVAQAKTLAGTGDGVVVQYDGAAPRSNHKRIAETLGDYPNVVVSTRRMIGDRRDWSMVRATIHAARVGLAQFPDASHFYLMSETCVPIKPAAHIRAALATDDRDFVESRPLLGSEGDWLRYRHVISPLRWPRLYQSSVGWQRKLGLTRTAPADLQMMAGSPWWCLRRASVMRILDFMAVRPDIKRFFRTTAYPAETVFQTLTRHLVPGFQVVPKSPTFTVTATEARALDHAMLMKRPEFFVSEAESAAVALRPGLLDLYRKGPPHLLTGLDVMTQQQAVMADHTAADLAQTG
ncbi:beta-1,6-N-acetylglucosaminyltransferase [Actibacterium sp. 188UL27-1]|uniref:beta-1,6-N-acetylglucosaminyltransferase n=1 Tax=Actibacterium sp. 188UL27-1 TaxID=2786961 RepID=UPI001957133F|nr:beta-1,6-N-acetylglucosaminyltransferase [Actibacterium sp. 188UL27-1]MBM7069516.1 hypothetical protein [Actibacterium sp. 188UL27-1]